MLKRIGKYVAEKVTQNVASMVVTWGFWTTVAVVGPTTAVSTVGIPIFAATAIAVHSGVFEYVAVRTVSNLITKDEQEVPLLK